MPGYFPSERATGICPRDIHSPDACVSGAASSESRRTMTGYFPEQGFQPVYRPDTDAIQDTRRNNFQRVQQSTAQNVFQAERRAQESVATRGIASNALEHYTPNINSAVGQHSERRSFDDRLHCATDQMAPRFPSQPDLINNTFTQHETDPARRYHSWKDHGLSESIGSAFPLQHYAGPDPMANTSLQRQLPSSSLSSTEPDQYSSSQPNEEMRPHYPGDIPYDFDATGVPKEVFDQYMYAFTYAAGGARDEVWAEFRQMSAFHETAQVTKAKDRMWKHAYELFIPLMRQMKQEKSVKEIQQCVYETYKVRLNYNKLTQMINRPMDKSPRTSFNAPSPSSSYHTPDFRTQPESNNYKGTSQLEERMKAVRSQFNSFKEKTKTRIQALLHEIASLRRELDAEREKARKLEEHNEWMADEKYDLEAQLTDIHMFEKPGSKRSRSGSGSSISRNSSMRSTQSRMSSR
ncbi:hypothetical protein HBH64_077710 [Parastagonospora nodorum]|nr:hypothetical protein HBI01_194450 [Parastagonospora nodorum]KAH4307823.1 hypothetical protein HBI02_108200 [Parastagonospora nodorum]KAH4323015.1 hypothetical protein HBI00_192080 [Parastagonospora nodorum]KAH4359483.1 hypothetical protein HBH94_204260 [Parastagonospora nodorum]KAH4453166.1 hypothetical protein HBH90_186750 [Parastagonospora nodorum]